jgi:hypothetical protein
MSKQRPKKSLLSQFLAVTLVTSMVLTMPGTAGWASTTQLGMNSNNGNNNSGTSIISSPNNLGLNASNVPPGTMVSNYAPNAPGAMATLATAPPAGTSTNLTTAQALTNFAQLVNGVSSLLAMGGSPANPFYRNVDWTGASSLPGTASNIGWTVNGVQMNNDQYMQYLVNEAKSELAAGIPYVGADGNFYKDIEAAMSPTDPSYATLMSAQYQKSIDDYNALSQQKTLDDVIKAAENERDADIAHLQKLNADLTDEALEQIFEANQFEASILAQQAFANEKLTAVQNQIKQLVNSQTIDQKLNALSKPGSQFVVKPISTQNPISINVNGIDNNMGWYQTTSQMDQVTTQKQKVEQSIRDLQAKKAAAQPDQKYNLDVQINQEQRILDSLGTTWDNLNKHLYDVNTSLCGPGYQYDPLGHASSQPTSSAPKNASGIITIKIGNGSFAGLGGCTSPTKGQSQSSIGLFANVKDIGDKLTRLSGDLTTLNGNYQSLFATKKGAQLGSSDLTDSLGYTYNPNIKGEDRFSSIMSISQAESLILKKMETEDAAAQKSADAAAKKAKAATAQKTNSASGTAGRQPLTNQAQEAASLGGSVKGYLSAYGVANDLLKGFDPAAIKDDEEANGKRKVSIATFTGQKAKVQKDEKAVHDAEMVMYKDQDQGSAWNYTSDILKTRSVVQGLSNSLKKQIDQMDAKLTNLDALAAKKANGTITPQDYSGLRSSLATSMCVGCSASEVGKLASSSASPWLWLGAPEDPVPQMFGAWNPNAGASMFGPGYAANPGYVPDQNLIPANIAGLELGSMGGGNIFDPDSADPFNETVKLDQFYTESGNGGLIPKRVNISNDPNNPIWTQAPLIDDSNPYGSYWDKASQSWQPLTGAWQKWFSNQIGIQLAPSFADLATDGQNQRQQVETLMGLQDQLNSDNAVLNNMEPNLLEDAPGQCTIVLPQFFNQPDDFLGYPQSPARLGVTPTSNGLTVTVLDPNAIYVSPLDTLQRDVAQWGIDHSGQIGGAMYFVPGLQIPAAGFMALSLMNRFKIDGEQPDGTFSTWNGVKGILPEAVGDALIIGSAGVLKPAAGALSEWLVKGGREVADFLGVSDDLFLPQWSRLAGEGAVAAAGDGALGAEEAASLLRISAASVPTVNLLPNLRYLLTNPFDALGETSIGTAANLASDGAEWIGNRLSSAYQQASQFASPLTTRISSAVSTGTTWVADTAVTAASFVADNASAAWKWFEDTAPTAAQFTSRGASFIGSVASGTLDLAAGAPGLVISGIRGYFSAVIPLSVRTFAVASAGTSLSTFSGLMGALTAPWNVLQGAVQVAGGAIRGNTYQVAQGMMDILGNATVNAVFFSAPGSLRNFINSVDATLGTHFAQAGLFYDPATGQPLTRDPNTGELVPLDKNSILPQRQASLFDEQGSGYASVQKLMDRWADASGSFTAKAIAWTSKTVGMIGDMASFAWGGKIAGAAAANLLGSPALAPLADALSAVAMRAPMLPFIEQQIGNYKSWWNGEMTLGKYVSELSSFAIGAALSHNLGPQAEVDDVSAFNPERAVDLPGFIRTTLTTTLTEVGKMAAMGALATALPENMGGLVTYGGAFVLPQVEEINRVFQAEAKAEGAQAQAAVELLQMNLQGTTPLSPAVRSEATSLISDNITREGDQFVVGGTPVDAKAVGAKVMAELQAIWDAKMGNGSAPTGAALGDGSWYLGQPGGNYMAAVNQGAGDLARMQLNPDITPTAPRAGTPPGEASADPYALPKAVTDALVNAGIAQPQDIVNQVVARLLDRELPITINPNGSAREQGGGLSNGVVSMEDIAKAVNQVAQGGEARAEELVARVVQSVVDDITRAMLGTEAPESPVENLKPPESEQAPVPAEETVSPPSPSRSMPTDQERAEAVEFWKTFSDEFPEPAASEPSRPSISEPSPQDEGTVIDEPPKPVAVTEASAKAPAPSELDQEVSRLLDQSNELRAEMLTARMRGLDILAQTAQSALSAVRDQLQVALDQRTSEAVDRIGDQAKGSTLPDLEAERTKALERLQQKYDPAREELMQQIATLQAAGEHDEANTLMTKLNKMDDEIQQKADAQANAAVDLAAAQREVLAQRAESIAETGRDLTKEQQAAALSNALKDVQEARKTAESTNQSFDPTERIQAAQDRINKVTEQTSKALADSMSARDAKQQLYADQRDALKQADLSPLKSSERQEALDKANEIGQQILRIDLAAQSREMAGRIAEIKAKGDLSATDALTLAKANYSKALADQQLALLNAAPATQVRLVAEAKTQLADLAGAVRDAQENFVGERRIQAAQKVIDREGAAKDKATSEMDRADKRATDIEPVIRKYLDRLIELKESTPQSPEERVRQRAEIKAMSDRLDALMDGRPAEADLTVRIDELAKAYTDSPDNSFDNSKLSETIDDLTARLEQSSRNLTADFQEAEAMANVAARNLDLANAYKANAEADLRGSWLDRVKAGIDVSLAKSAVRSAQDASIDVRAEARAERTGDRSDIGTYKKALRVTDEYRRTTGVQIDPELIARMHQIGNSLEVVTKGEGKDARVVVRFKDGAALKDGEKLVNQVNEVFRAFEDVANEGKGEGEDRMILEVAQAKKILESFKNSSVLLEMPTGFGKTTTVLPLQGILTRLLLGNRVSKVVLVFTDSAKAKDAFDEKIATNLFKKYESQIGAAGLIDETHVGHGQTAKALEIAKESGILFVTRSALKTLKLNTETAEGSELAVSKRTYDLITKNTHGIFDEAHELPDTSHLILGRDGVKVTEAHPQIVEAMGRIDSWLTSLKSQQERLLGYSIDNKTFYQWLEDGGDGRFIPTKQGLRISEKAINEYFDLQYGKEGTTSLREFLNDDKYIPDRASLLAATRAIDATYGSDYAMLQDAKGHEGDSPVRIVPVAEGKANAEMRFGDPYEAAAKQLIGARRLYDAKGSVETILEEATTNDKAVRVTDASVINDFATKTFVTGTGKSVGDAFAFGLGIESANSSELFTRYRDGGRNTIVGGELKYGANLSDAYDAAFRNGSPDRSLNYVVGNEAKDIHAYDSIKAFGDRFGDTHNLVFKIGDRMFVGDAQGHVLAELKPGEFADLLLPLKDGQVNRLPGRLGDIIDSTKKVAVYLDQGAVTGTDLKLQFFKLTDKGNTSSDLEATALAKQTMFIDIFGEKTDLTRAGQALGRDRMYGREGDNGGRTIANQKMILMVGESYKDVNSDPKKFIDLLTQREDEGRNARIQKTFSDSLQEAMVNRFRLMTENADTTSTSEREAINRARTEFQSEASVNHDLTAPLTQKASVSLQAEIERLQNTFEKSVGTELMNLSDTNQEFFKLTANSRVSFNPSNETGVFVIENGYVKGLRTGVQFERGLSSMDFAEAVHTINEKFSKADFAFESSQPRSSYAGVMAADAAIRRTIDGLRRGTGDSNGAGPLGPDSAGNNGSGSGRAVPVDSYNLLGQRSGRNGGPSSESADAYIPKTVPLTLTQGQPAVHAQGGVAISDLPVEPQPLIPGKADLGAETSTPPIEMQSNGFPQAARTLTVPEIMLLRAQAIQAVQQAGMQAPPLVAAVAGASSLQEIAQLLYSQAGVQAPAGSLVSTGNLGRWSNLVFSNQNSVVRSSWQTFTQATKQTASKGWSSVTFNPMSIKEGLKSIGGMVMATASPVLGAVAAVMPQDIQSSQKVGLLMNAAGSNVKSVIPMLRSLAASKPDIVFAALNDKAIEAAAKKSGTNKDQVIADLRQIRVMAVTASPKYRSVAGFEERRALNDNVVVATFDPRSDSHFDRAVELTDQSQASHGTTSVFLNPILEARQDPARMEALRAAVRQANDKGASVSLVGEDGVGLKLTSKGLAQARRMPIIPISIKTQVTTAVSNLVKGQKQEAPFNIARLEELQNQLENLRQQFSQPASGEGAEKIDFKKVMQQAQQLQSEIVQLATRIGALAPTYARSYALLHPSSSVSFRMDPVQVMLNALVQARTVDEILKAVNDFANPALTPRQMRRLAAEAGISLASVRPHLNKTPLQFVPARVPPLTAPQAFEQALNAPKIKGTKVTKMSWNVVFGKFIDQMKQNPVYKGKTVAQQVSQLEKDVTAYVRALPVGARAEAERVFIHTLDTTFPKGQAIAPAIEAAHIREVRSRVLAQEPKDKQTVWVVPDQATKNRLYPPTSPSAGIPAAGQPVITQATYQQYQQALEQYQADTRKERLQALPSSWKTGLTAPRTAWKPTPIFTAGRVALAGGLMLGAAVMALVLGAPMAVVGTVVAGGLGVLGSLLVYRGGLDAAIPQLKAMSAPEPAPVPAASAPIAAKPALTVVGKSGAEVPDAIAEMLPAANPKVVEMPAAKSIFNTRFLSRAAGVLVALVLVGNAKAEGFGQVMSVIHSIDPTYALVSITGMLSAIFFRKQIASGVKVAANQMLILTNA